MRFETKAVHTGEDHGKMQNGDVVVPLHLATTFARSKMDASPQRLSLFPGGQSYPHRAGRAPGSLGERDRRACLQLRAWARKRPRCSCSRQVTGCSPATTYTGARTGCSKNASPSSGYGRSTMDLHDEALLSKELRAGAAMLWIETPSNPTLRVYDIQELSDMAHRLDPNTIVVVDNTFASPVLPEPARPGCRHRDPFDHQVHRGAQRRDRRGAGGEGPAVLGKTERLPESDRGGPQPLRRIPHLEGHPHAPAPHGKARGERPWRWPSSSAPMSS